MTDGPSIGKFKGLDDKNLEQLQKENRRKIAGDKKKFEFNKKNITNALIESKYNVPVAMLNSLKESWNEPGTIDEMKKKYGEDIAKKLEKYYEEEKQNLGRELTPLEKEELKLKKLGGWDKTKAGGKAAGAGAWNIIKKGKQLVLAKPLGMLSSIPKVGDMLAKPMAKKLGVKLDESDPTDKDLFLSGVNGMPFFNPNFFKKLSDKEMKSELISMATMTPLKIIMAMGGVAGGGTALAFLTPILGPLVAVPAIVMMVMGFKSLVEEVGIKTPLTIIRIVVSFVRHGVNHSTSKNVNIEMSPKEMEALKKNAIDPEITAGMITNNSMNISATKPNNPLENTATKPNNPLENTKTKTNSPIENTTTKTNSPIENTAAVRTPEDTAKDIGKPWKFDVIATGAASGIDKTPLQDQSELTSPPRS